MDCYTEDCNWDGDECDNVIGDYCDYPYCLRSQVGDGNCDRECYNDYCDRDGGDCDAYGYCGQMDGYTDRDIWWCNEDMIGNNHCDDRCNNEDCGYDGGDCDFTLVYYTAEFVDNTCTGDALEVLAKYCTNQNDWVCDCPSEPVCYPESGNLLEGCATVDEFDALINDWFKEEPAWDATFANTDCHGRPSMIYYWTNSDCILIDNNLWRYTEWSPEGVRVLHICTDRW
ncbi:hypothetical protein Pelo_168 [Pelomyxa schiedti]|nr:hypothetical protein Pelo_168 [Pelomyxa schiedti]